MDTEETPSLCPNCEAPQEAGVVLCPQCGAPYEKKEWSERLPLWLALVITLVATVATGILFGWPWAVVGTWVGWVSSTTFCGDLLVGLLTIVMMLLTGCLVGPLELFFCFPAPWRWLGVACFTLSFAYGLWMLGFVRKGMS